MNTVVANGHLPTLKIQMDLTRTFLHKNSIYVLLLYRHTDLIYFVMQGVNCKYWPYTSLNKSPNQNTQMYLTKFITFSGWFHNQSQPLSEVDRNQTISKTTQIRQNAETKSGKTRSLLEQPTAICFRFYSQNACTHKIDFSLSKNVAHFIKVDSSFI